MSDITTTTTTPDKVFVFWDFNPAVPNDPFFTETNLKCYIIKHD